MRISWGYSILISISAFVLMMGYLAYRSVNTHYELVSEKYYHDELEYQNVIDAGKNALTLSRTLQLEFAENTLNVLFPVEMQSASLTGTIYFYCPTAAQKDRRFTIDINKGGRQSIPLNKLLSGSYTVKTDWNYEGRHYYTEQNILIP
jgi:hypothetical protein